MNGIVSLEKMEIMRVETNLIMRERKRYQDLFLQLNKVIVAHRGPVVLS